MQKKKLNEMWNFLIVKMTEIVNCIIKQTGIDVDIIQQTFRVPRERQQDSPTSKIVVSLTTRYDKSKVLEKASSLRERGNKWKKVYIN